MKHTFELDFDGRKIVVEAGEIAKHTVFSVLFRSATTKFVEKGSRFLSTHSTEA